MANHPLLKVAGFQVITPGWFWVIADKLDLEAPDARRAGIMNHQPVTTTILMAALLATVSSCATPYGRLSGRFGYDDFRISEDTFEVSFSGNSHTPSSVVSRYVFRRAAEVTLKNGFTHFAPLGEQDRSLYGAFNTASGTTYTHTNPQGGGAWSHSSGSGVNIPFQMPASSMRIRCFKGKPPENDSVIDAQAFLDFNFRESPK